MFPNVCVVNSSRIVHNTTLRDNIIHKYIYMYIIYLLLYEFIMFIIEINKYSN